MMVAMEAIIDVTDLGLQFLEELNHVSEFFFQHVLRGLVEQLFHVVRCVYEEVIDLLRGAASVR